MSSIENVLQSLLSDKSVTNALSKHISQANTENESTVPDTQNGADTPKANTRLEQKINLINAIIPLLSENAAEKAEFLIKLLGIISVIEEMKQSQ